MMAEAAPMAPKKGAYSGVSVCEEVDMVRSSVYGFVIVEDTRLVHLISNHMIVTRHSRLNPYRHTVYTRDKQPMFDSN